MRGRDCPKKQERSPGQPTGWGVGPRPSSRPHGGSVREAVRRSGRESPSHSPPRACSVGFRCEADHRGPPFSFESLGRSHPSFVSSFGIRISSFRFIRLRTEPNNPPRVTTMRYSVGVGVTPRKGVRNGQHLWEQELFCCHAMEERQELPVSNALTAQKVSTKTLRKFRSHLW